MSFSLYHTDGARAICRIKWPGTKLHNMVVYMSEKLPVQMEPTEKKVPKRLLLSDDDMKELEDEVIGIGSQKPMDALGVDFFKRGDHNSYLRKGDMAIMKDALEEDADDLDEYEELKSRPDVKSYMQQKLLDAKAELKSRKREFNVYAGGSVIPMIDINDRECGTAIGPAKSGKSFLVGQLAADYAKRFPDNDIYLVSVVDDDPSLAHLQDRITVQPLDQAFIKNIYDGLGKTLRDCCVIFDDVDSMENEAMKQAIWKLRATLLERGRHSTVYVYNTSHQFRAGKQTKAANAESSWIAVFPGGGDTYHMKDYLKTYCGFSPEAIQKLLSLPSRWAMVYTHRPSFVLHEHGAYFNELPKAIQSGPKRRKVGMFD